jgi:hypothetical protein
MSNKRVSTTGHVVLLAVVLLSLLVLVLASSSARAETKVNLPDSNIRATIGQAINKPAGDIYRYDLADQTGNISSLFSLSDLSELYSLLNNIINTSSPSGLSDLSGLDSLLSQTGNISSLSGLGDPSELDSLLDQIVNTASPSGLGDLSELNPMIALIVNSASSSGLSDLSGPSGLNLGRNQISDVSPVSKSAPTGKKDMGSIVVPIVIVAAIALLVDLLLTLRARKVPCRRLRRESRMR